MKFINWIAATFRKTKAYFKNSRDELKKVNWPSLDEVKNMAFIVFMFILISAILLGIADFISFKLISRIFSL